MGWSAFGYKLNIILKSKILIIIIIMSLSSVLLSKDSAGDAPMSREVQTAPLTQQDQSRHRGGVYFGSGHLAKKSVRKRE